MEDCDRLVVTDLIVKEEPLMEKRKLLVVVDMQNDFVDGVLGTPEARAIVPEVVRKIEEYKAKGDYVVYTLDTHAEDYLETQEGRKLPVEHCVFPLDGWKLYLDVAGALEGARSVDGSRATEYRKGGFGSWDLGEDVKHWEDALASVEFVGVCTGICVISNAVLVKSAVPEMPVVVDAKCCACTTVKSHETALDAMGLLQVEIVNRS